jgi:hypothetical protein
MTCYFNHPIDIEAEIQREIQELEQIRTTATPSRFLTRMRAEGRP